MEITRTRSLTISMGDYESFKTESTVRVSHRDHGISDEGLPELSGESAAALHDSLLEMAGGLLDQAMADDIADAQHLSGNRKSFIHRIPTEKDK